MSFKNIILSFDGALATISMNRPPVNALNGETLDELGAAFDAISSQKNTRVVLINSTSEKAFIAGADLVFFTKTDPSAVAEIIEKGQKLYDRIESFPLPVIAVINGHCLGGGCELVIACDLRIASEKARFGQPEINLGIIPGWGGTQRLPRLIGKNLALEMILTGDAIDSQKALKLGLVNMVVPPDKLAEEAQKMAKKLAAKAPLAVKAIIEAVDKGLSLPLKEGEKIEAEAFVKVFASEDAREGIKAFLEKRVPEFKNK